MVLWTFIISVSIGSVFVFVIFFGAPFLPSHHKQIDEALDMLYLRPGQTLLELGSGDGRVLLAAAKRGIVVIGYELNPILAGYSYLVTRRYRHLVTVKCANFWKTPLRDCDAIYTFLMKPYMVKLDAKIAAETLQPLKLLSISFSVTGRKAVKQSNGLFLYLYGK